MKNASSFPRLRRIISQTLPAKAEARLADFIRQAWPIVEPGTPYVHGWHIERIAEHLEAVSRGEIHRLVLNMPPRHMKSLAICVFWPCWEWIRNPGLRYLFASHALDLSVRDSLKCRRLLQSAWYRRNWGHVFRLAGDQNSKGRFENDRSGLRLAVSVGSGVTGEGGDRIVVDDPHNARDVLSTRRREAVLEWWDQAMSTRLNNPAKSAMIIVMQRLHERDLSGHVLSRGGWVHLKLPAAYEGARIISTAPAGTGLCVEDERQEPGQPLWPGRFDQAALDRLRESLGSWAAAGQLQQQPAPTGGGVFKRAWWRHFRQAPVFTRLIQSWDTGFKSGETNAYSVGQTWGQAENGYYLIDQLRERLEYPELRRAVMACYEKHKPELVLIEDKASGQSLVQELRRATRLPLLALPVKDGDKLLRAQQVSPLVESGRVFLPEQADWLADFLDEAGRFPNAAFADQVDAAVQALRWLSQGRRYEPSGARFWN